MKYILVFLSMLPLMSCLKNDVDSHIDNTDYKVQNQAEIEKYILDNNLQGVQKTDSGLYYIVEEQGNGKEITKDDVINIKQQTFLTNGNLVVDQKKGTKFYLEDVLPGVKEGSTYFNEGGRGKLLLPSHLAYGNATNLEKIPSGSVIIIDFKIEKIIDYNILNKAQIEDYLTENSLKASQTDTGLYYILHTPGSGKQAFTTGSIKVRFKETFINGGVINDLTKSINFKNEQTNNDNLSGLLEGVQLLKEGGNATLIIPSNLAYGKGNIINNNQGLVIPGGSVIIIDLELISVEQ